jgi:hypothetical protein
VLPYSTYFVGTASSKNGRCLNEALIQMTMPDMSAQKLREQEVGEAFIKEYNRNHNTDFLVDREYREEFPDIKFKSASNILS